MGYCTGYRAIVNPFPTLSEFDPNTGICIISDKDGNDLYNSRTVWLPPMAVQQLANYRYHRLLMLTHLALHHKGRSRSYPPDIFLLDHSIKIKTIKPSNLAPHLQAMLPLPINSNRRFLRTKLRLNGCPPEIIDAFMGHWARGEEPWGKYSTLSYLQILKSLKTFLPPIVTALGFKPIESRLNEN